MAIELNSIPVLWVTQDDPVGAHVPDHGRADGAREGALRFFVAVLQGEDSSETFQEWIRL